MIVQHGKLAYEWCNVKLPLAILHSASGWYIGTFDPDEGPISRESEEYWDTMYLAENALNIGEWTQRDIP